MKSVSNRILAAAFVGCGIVAVLLWSRDPHSAQGAGGSLQTTDYARKAQAANNAAIAASISKSSEESLGRFAQEKYDGLFNETATQLVRSNSLAKLDYGLRRLPEECRSWTFGANAATQALKEADAALAPRLTPPSKLLRDLTKGSATESVRMAAFHRSIEKCAKHFQDRSSTLEKWEDISGLPLLAESNAITKTLRGGTPPDFVHNTSAMAAVSKIVAEPMFGQLQSLVANSVDFSELSREYGPEQISTLRALSMTIISCRMGDDCGTGGLVTDNVCWSMGMCGGRAEDAIVSSLREQGLDTRALNEFLTRVYQGLQSRDPAIFKRPK